MPEGLVLCYWASTPGAGLRNLDNESCISLEVTSGTSPGLLWKRYGLLCESQHQAVNFLHRSKKPCPCNSMGIMFSCITLPGVLFPLNIFLVKHTLCLMSKTAQTKDAIISAESLTSTACYEQWRIIGVLLYPKEHSKLRLCFLKGVSNWSHICGAGGKIAHVRLFWPNSTKEDNDFRCAEKPLKQFWA